MPNYCCNAVGCSNSVKRKQNLEKYPELKDVTFHSFPHATREKTKRQQWIRQLRREQDWKPNKLSRVCSRHFVNEKGPTLENPVPTLFEYNDYKRRPTELSSKVTELRDAIRASQTLGLKLLWR